MKIKTRYSVFQNLAYVFRNVIKFDKLIIFFLIIFIPVNVINSFIPIYIISSIVGFAEKGDEPHLLLYILILALIQTSSILLLNFLKNQLATRNYKLRMNYIKDYVACYMKADYAFIESEYGMRIGEKAKKPLYNFFYGQKPNIEKIPDLCMLLVSSILGLFLYGGIVSALNPLMIVFLVGITLVSLFKQRITLIFHQKFKDPYNDNDRQIKYIYNRTRDTEYVKDIKLYSMQNWFVDKFDFLMKIRYRLLFKMASITFGLTAIMTFLNLGFNSFVYYYLINSYMSAQIGVSEFILYFGLITNFNIWIKTIIDNVEEINKCCYDVDDLRVFFDLSEETVKNGLTDVKFDNYSIEFCNVGFSYPSSDRLIIKDINFKINPSEKIAIVGLNGAGKTTLVKLLCNLYAPTKGKILIGGTDISNISPAALFKEFSVVFQDVYFLPTSIEKNITLSETTDIEKYEKCTILSGINAKINSLPQKQDTPLCRGVLDDSVSLSGGEVQKLALARSLYKNGSIIVLDEPTAALDPISENEMYQKYSELTYGKTSVFISHRLSSTRFCDRILFLENGKIAEEGSHNELMKKNGKYAHLYTVQSQYYDNNFEVRK